MQDSDNGAPLSRTQDKPDMTISSLCSRDIPGVYIPYGVGIAIVLTIERLYPDYFTRARFEETRRVFKEHYDHWLDPNNANGIAALVAATTTEVNNRRTALDSRPRAIVSTSYDFSCTYQTTVNISGDFTNG